jgi:hypothetical protein
MYHYVTLFDSNFLPQGLALYESLTRHASPFTLWVLCMDDKAKDILQRLSKPGLKAIALSELETAQLLEIKRQRSLVEYCWTLTPMAPKIVFDRDSSVERVTYLDADLFFLKNPEPIHHEFRESGKSVLITEHWFDSFNDRSAQSGRFCVQFMTFVRTKSEAVRQWWEARCVEWCFARCEGGKFGDQKYLDDWPSRFPDEVHVLEQPEAIQAPWNARRFHHSEAIAWHFHALRLIGNGKVRLHPSYSIPKEVDKHIYNPYVSTLHCAVAEIGEPVVQHSPRHLSHHLHPRIKHVARQLLKAGISFKTIKLRDQLF